MYDELFVQYQYVRFEVFTAVAMKNTVFWDVMPCGFYKNRYFGGMYCLHYQGDKNQRAMNKATLMMAAICSSKMSVRTRTTWCNIQEDGSFHVCKCL
jgi:hypothetical protein